MMQSRAQQRTLHDKEDLMRQHVMLEDRGSIEEIPPRAGARTCVRRERRHSPSDAPASAWQNCDERPERKSRIVLGSTRGDNSPAMRRTYVCFKGWL